MTDAQRTAPTKPSLPAAYKLPTRHRFTNDRNKAPSILAHQHAPATCGELVQGVVNGEDFLVNCPINRFTSAAATLDPKAGTSVCQSESLLKVRSALSLLANRQVSGLKVKIVNDIPRGKGMGSNSAELAAIFSAVSMATGNALDSWAISYLLSYIGPSNAAHLRGISHVNQISGTIIDLLPPPRGLSVLIVDCKAATDPAKIDRSRANAIHHEEKKTVLEARNLVRIGLLDSNLRDIAKAATKSATLNQRISFKPVFDELLSSSISLGALGVNCAHNGTVLGVLYRTDNRSIVERLYKDIDTRFGESVNVLGHHQVIEGGCRSQVQT